MRYRLRLVVLGGLTSLLLAAGAGMSWAPNSDSNRGHVSVVSSKEATAPFPVQDKVYVSGIRHATKKPDFGGETCIAMYLVSIGHNVDQDCIFDASGLDPMLGRGCHTKELVVAAKKIGLQPGPVWLAANDKKSVLSIWESMLVDLKQDLPSVVCRVDNGIEQFSLVIGYDPDSDKVILHNPNIANGANEKVDRESFLDSCLLRQSATGSSHKKSFVRIRLASDRISIRDRQTTFTDADFCQHVRQLKQRLPHDGFHMVLQKPFVVVGDGSLENVQRSAISTVKWAVDSIKKDYFTKDPNYIIDVWLFKDPKSYQHHNQLLFGEKPSTPFGYFSPANRALVMDISTGGGTLVHEIVHPFMESNFEACPSWFNEGLASLYEQSSQRDGHIIGLTNWRLRGLQLTIRDGRLQDFETLCSTTRREFYEGAGTNYAQARYLCYYLQEHGLLIKFYHQMNKNIDTDPGGFETLKKILGQTDLAQFQKQWEAYVLKLKFPG